LETRDVAPLLEGAAKILNAVGLVVWIWDPHQTALRPALAHGYSDDVLAQLPGVRRDADNATATAFRSAQTRIVNGSDLASGAVVVPLMTPGGCGGVLAVELRHGREQSESVRALAMIFAAQLATLVGFAPLAEAVNAYAARGESPGVAPRPARRPDGKARPASPRLRRGLAEVRGEG
jgi:hypothetical protein